MTALSGHVISNSLTNDHALSSALNAAMKVYSLLPGDITLCTLVQLPGQVLGQVAPPDDAMAIAWVSWVAGQPGWWFEQGLPERNEFTKRTYMRIAAATEVNGVKVAIWAHIAADVQPAAATGAAA